MKNEIISQLKQNLDTVAQKFSETEIEFWYARDLMNSLGYLRWENFSKIIEKSKESCQNSGITVIDHFRDVTKMVSGKKINEKY